MPRPPKQRVIHQLPDVTIFKPAGIPARRLKWQSLGLDHWEAIRLADAEGLDQASVAERMGVSRTTAGRLITEGRRIVATVLAQGEALAIEGGTVCIRQLDFAAKNQSPDSADKE